MDADCECAPWVRLANPSDSWALVISVISQTYVKSPISRIYTVTYIRLANWTVRTALVSAVVTAAHATAAAAAAAAVTLWMEMQRQVAADSHRVADG